MSIYGNWYCRDCKITLFLGRFCWSEAEPGNEFFARGPTEASKHVETTRALWKLIATHHGHDTCVLVEGDPGESELWDDDSWIEIGGDREQDISFTDFLRGWEG